MEILQYTIFGLFGLFLIVQFYYRYVSEKQIDSIIKDIYQKQNITADEISDLSIAERLKYGAPVNNLIGAQNLMSTLFTHLGESHYKKVDTIDENEDTQIRFIEVYIKKRVLIKHKEFDCYNF